MYVNFHNEISEILDLASSQPLTREINGELFTYAFQDWQRYLDYEDQPNYTVDDQTLYFGLGSRRNARNIIQTGEKHRLYEPNPFRLARFLKEYPQFLKNQHWKIGTGLWVQEGFFEGDFSLECHSLLKTLYDPLPDLMVNSPGSFSDFNSLIIQVGDLFYRDVIETLKEYETPLWPLQLAHWSEEGIKAQLLDSASELIFTINVIDDLADLCADVKMEYISWEIDPATSPYLDVSDSGSEYSRIYTYRRNNVSRLSDAGYKQVKYMPLASNISIRRPLENQSDEGYETKISFVGSSMRTNAQRQLGKILEEINRRVQANESWDQLRSQLLEWKETPPDWDEDIISLVKDVLDRLNLPDVITIDGEPIYLPMTIGEYRAYQKRAQVVESVGDNFPIDVWGDQGWSEHLGDLGTYRGEAGHGIELTKIYNASQINLDVNRIYQSDIVTMRVFDAMSCGSVVLSESSEAIQELFVSGEECFLYESRNDLLETIDELLQDDNLRSKTGKKARRAITGSHTINHRLSRMGIIESP